MQQLPAGLNHLPVTLWFVEVFLWSSPLIAPVTPPGRASLISAWGRCEWRAAECVGAGEAPSAALMFKAGMFIKAGTGDPVRRLFSPFFPSELSFQQLRWWADRVHDQKRPRHPHHERERHGGCDDGGQQGGWPELHRQGWRGDMSSFAFSIWQCRKHSAQLSSVCWVLKNLDDGKLELTLCGSFSFAWNVAGQKNYAAIFIIVRINVSLWQKFRATEFLLHFERI